MSQWSAVDLHLHTTASDGALSPAALVELAAQRGLRVIALTDHDSTGGVDAAIQAAATLAPAMEVISGVELNTDVPQGEAHILGYFLDHHQPAFAAILEQRRAARLDRGRQMVEKLKAIGLGVSWERVQELAGAATGGAVGRPHVARALMERGHVATVQEAFDRYLGRNGPAYVEYARFTPEEAVQTIAQAGGLPALAHPTTWAGFEDRLPALIEAGLEGLECYYSMHNLDTTEQLLAAARQYHLAPTGGSDFHRESFDAPTGTLGGTLVPFSVVEGLKARRR